MPPTKPKVVEPLAHDGAPEILRTIGVERNAADVAIWRAPPGSLAGYSARARRELSYGVPVGVELDEVCRAVALDWLGGPRPAGLLARLAWVRRIVRAVVAAWLAP